MLKYTLIIFLLMMSCAQKNGLNLPNPLLHAHAHNDYQHPHPLFDALSSGFTSVEEIFIL